MPLTIYMYILETYFEHIPEIPEQKCDVLDLIKIDFNYWGQFQHRAGMIVLPLSSRRQTSANKRATRPRLDVHRPLLMATNILYLMPTFVPGMLFREFHASFPLKFY